MTVGTTLFALLLMGGALVACSGTSGGLGTGNGSPVPGSSGSGSDNGSSGATGGAQAGQGQPSEPGSSSGGTIDFADASSTSTGGVSLTVTSVTSAATVDSFPPAAGTAFVVVDLTLANTGARMPLPTDPLFFSLQTADAIVVSASLEQPPGACSSADSVAGGGHIACEMAFEVPLGQTPATLVYDDHAGDRASASLTGTLSPSAACERYAGWLQTSPTGACAGCLSSTEGTLNGGSAGGCMSAAHAYGSACGVDAGAQCLTSNDVCSCEIAADSASCHALFDAFVGCIVSACASSCP
jgi:hypothetical protein